MMKYNQYEKQNQVKAGVLSDSTAGNFRLSINFKIWLAIMFTVVVVIAALWFFQVVFLEDYYLGNKEDEILKNAQQVVSIIDKNGVDNSIEDVYQIALENTVCIDVSDQYGSPYFVTEALGDTCFIHMSDINKAKVVSDASVNRGRYVITDIKHPKYDTRYFTCSVLEENDVGNYIITLTATLAPVKEAAGVIRTQLFYASIAMILISTTIAFFLARSLTRPIKKISMAARKVANGDFGIAVNVKSKDELGELSQNFNNMTKELSKVNVLQKELVANISHDMRTPLTMIKGYAEAIKDITGDNKEMREHQLDIIVEESNRLSTLVSDVMDLSLLQAGQSNFNFNIFDIAMEVSGILGRFELLEQTSGFEFKLLSYSPSVLAIGDAVRIDQVLYNLINNAVNHIGDIKRITVSIVDIGENIKIEITDTGKGIAQNDLPLIWDRYYKPYRNTEQKSMGTGLGLSIVKAVLINHHSRFGVVSTLGEGSTFWFTLKKAKDEEIK